MLLHQFSSWEHAAASTNVVCDVEFCLVQPESICWWLWHESTVLESALRAWLPSLSTCIIYGVAAACTSSTAQRNVGWGFSYEVALKLHVTHVTLSDTMAHILGTNSPCQPMCRCQPICSKHMLLAPTLVMHACEQLIVCVKHVLQVP